MLDVQKFLMDHTLEDLSTSYGIHIREHIDHPNLVSLKYGRDRDLFGERIVQECRGLILDKDNNFSVVSFPFLKFFNLHEPNAAHINWDTTEILSKLDGSLMTMYCYDNTWYASTSGTPDGHVEISPVSSMTFSDLFWEIFLKNGYQTPDPNFCYMFELTSPYNRIVVPYKESNITLIGIRNLKTFKECSLDVGIEFGFDVVRSFDLGNLDGILEASKKLDPMKEEGYVVRDSDFNRVKIKGPRYVEMHHLRNSVTPKGILNIVINGETTEFISYFPEYANDFLEMESKVNNLVTKVQECYEKFKNVSNRKEFAIEVNKYPYADILFYLYSGQKDIREYLRRMSGDRLIKLVENDIV